MTYKSKDFYYVYISVYPSDLKHLKIKDSSDPRWHEEASKIIKIWVLFKDKLLEKCFGVNQNFFRQNYGCFTNETIEEFLEIWHNIRLYRVENGYELFIPSAYVELIHWISENKPSWAQERTRSHMGMINIRPQRTEFDFAHEARAFSIEFIKKHAKVLKYEFEELKIEDKINLFK